MNNLSKNSTAANKTHRTKEILIKKYKLYSLPCKLPGEVEEWLLKVVV